MHFIAKTSFIKVYVLPLEAIATINTYLTLKFLFLNTYLTLKFLFLFLKLFFSAKYVFSDMNLFTVNDLKQGGVSLQ